jgi:hypothetical protein
VSWVQPGTRYGYLFLFMVSLLVFFVAIAFLVWVAKWLSQRPSLAVFRSRRKKDGAPPEDERPG